MPSSSSPRSAPANRRGPGSIGKSSPAGRRPKGARLSKAELVDIAKARARQQAATVTARRRQAAARLMKLGDPTERRRKNIDKNLATVHDPVLLRQIREASDEEIRAQAGRPPGGDQINPWWYH